MGEVEASEAESAVRSLLGRLWQDCKTAGVACVIGLAAMALVDLLATIITAPGPVSVATVARLVALEVALATLLFPPAALLLLGLASAVRLLRRATGGRDSEPWTGLLGPARPRTEASHVAAWMWGITLASIGYIAASTALSVKLGALYKEPQLTALVLAFVQLILFGLLLGVAWAISLGARALGRLLHQRLRAFNPFGSGPAAGVALVLVAWPIVRVTLAYLPQLAPLIPWRILLSLGCFALGTVAATHLLAWRGGLWPAGATHRLRAIAVAAFVFAALLPLTLVKIGADPDTKALAIAASPTMSKTMDWVRRATDFDRDGFGSLLGENDCAPFNRNIHPLARDIPDNGVDENCDGRDFRLGTLPSYKTGERRPVPDAYQKDDWNVLLVTIDTVRYDHTSFGGYVRDTTPRLAEFAKRSANFTFANAPSAGTMASIPAILTSKFFHSGIALDEDVPRGSPPKLLEINTLLPELFKKKGYRTGAILSHEYFNDWGMEQGVDDYDNTIGKKRAPYAVTSEKLTERAIAWIGKQRKRKWFLWIHYIDPHGRYVDHPGETSYGETEKDLYDGELHFTDKHLGNLLDYVARSPGGNKTIIALTSDHGDGFGEHGYINHGQDLHRELLHVPLIFYVPNIEPRKIPGPVSPIDIFPTLTDLIGVDVSHLNTEGESLVPQLFYGEDAEKRVVFAETNWPKPLRAVISSRYKLILDLKNNVSRLFDLKKDPLEKTNVFTKDKAGYTEMRGYLNEWIERVVYARDAVSNQAIGKLQDHLVRESPKSAEPVKGVSVDGGKIVVDSYEMERTGHKAGDKVPVALYFRTKEATDLDIVFQLEAWIESGPNARRSAKSRRRLTAGGMFPTSRWHKGEMVRDRFKLTLPVAWASEAPGTEVKLGIRFRKKAGNAKPTWTGELRKGSGDLLILGSFTLSGDGKETAPSEPGKQPTKGPATRTLERKRPGGKALRAPPKPASR